MVEIGKPAIGMIVRGHYRWREQADAGIDHAPYSRPCLVMRVFEHEGQTGVSVLPLTSKPQAEGRGFELPHEIARRFNLPRGASHVVTAESQKAAWTPEFYENIPGRDTPVYGHLTPGLTRKAGDQYAENMQKQEAERNAAQSWGDELEAFSDSRSAGEESKQPGGPDQDMEL